MKTSARTLAVRSMLRITGFAGFTVLVLVFQACNPESSSKENTPAQSNVESAEEEETQNWVTRGGTNYGIFAPEDAWLEGDSLPYYGSENEWSRRMFEQGAADRFYKRRGQRQILAILDGEPEKAIGYCNARLEEDPDDPETHFMLSVAYCSSGKLKKAESEMKLALQNGLPFSRYLAGPRELIAPLKKTKTFMTNLETSSPVVHGPMLGRITSGGFSCWVRTSEESKLVLEAWEANSPFTETHSEYVTSKAENDYTAIMEIDGLKPQTSYNYNIIVDGQPVFETIQAPEFRTSRRPGSEGVVRIAFGGGAGYTPEAEKIWSNIRDYNPDALLLLGDNVYVDLPEIPGAFHDYTYYRRQSRSEYKSLISRVPVYAIWDDHDAGIDDIWMGPYKNKPEWKIPLVRHFERNWINPAYGSAEWPGCWFNFTLGDVDFFMLDGRTYRTTPFGSDPTMLGPIQKQWLFEKLSASNARVKVLISPVPWSLLAKPDSHDTWNGFIEERNEIFNYIENQEIPGIVLVSADRHRSEVWKIEREGSYPFYEFISSRLTNMHFHEILPGSVYSYNEQQSFGGLNFNTTGDKPSVTFEIINLDNEMVYQEEFLLGE